MIYMKKLSEIYVPIDRQRTEFDPDKHQELLTSIEEVGLINPICLRKPFQEELDNNLCLPDQLCLVAGERRFRAMKELHELGAKFTFSEVNVPHNSFPCIIYEELSTSEAVQIELDENIRRANLTWQEQAKATERLAKLLGKLAAEDGTAPPTIATITKLITGKTGGSTQDTIRTDLIVAKNLDNPAIAKASSAREALKILKTQEEVKKNIALAEEVGQTYGKKNIEIYNDDCLWLLSQPRFKGMFDVILTDPPYGMDADEFGDGSGRVSDTHDYDDSYDSWQSLMKGFAQLSYEVTKEQAHAYIFCDIDNFHELKKYMTEAGWKVFRTPLTSRKLNSGRVPDPTCGPRRQAEWILYAVKGRKPVKIIAPDVINNSGDNPYNHGAGKSTELYTDLLHRSVSPGDKVLDAFAGTFTILRAAKPLKLDVVAIEENSSYYGIGVTELNRLYED